MARDEATLLDIAQAVRLILDFVGGMKKEEFLEDFRTQSAVLHQLMVMGEAVKRLSSEFRTRFPQISWSLIAGMRDKLIHGYDIVDLEEVWRTVESDVPALLTQIEPLLPEHRHEE